MKHEESSGNSRAGWRRTTAEAKNGFRSLFAWMRKAAWAACFLIFLFSSAGAGSSNGTVKGKLTLMVYMCGSNLESGSGAATADIHEMIQSGLKDRDVSILVMTGGSESEELSGYFSAESSGIYEISGGRCHRVWKALSALNMGSPESLSRLLRYGMTNRPAEQYALILWDHGGGPLEGVCWDESYEMDHLSLHELTEALEGAGLEKKLSWIGFDACLMSSLEVAGQMAPYAEYMIASQETEPASGWNYAFLKEAAGDANGAETGRRIVDAYFEGKENSGEILTMACIDLSAAKLAIDALDPVFSSLETNISEETFLNLSGLRMSAAGFGKEDPSQNNTGYDLVDVQDFVSHLESTEEAEYLLSCLKSAVVYSRANEENAYGLTVYHPYTNKSGYQKKWKNAYEEIGFSESYQAYVKAFGQILTGKPLFAWQNLIPEQPEADGEGNYLFELPLTQEQANHIVSAQVLIMRDTLGNELTQCALVATVHAEMTEDHTLRASWDGRALYVETGDGQTEGPIGFAQTKDGRRNIVSASYYKGKKIGSDGSLVHFELDPEDDSEYPQIQRTLVWDEATESMSSRLKISEDQYQLLMLTNDHRVFPGKTEDGVLPPFSEWNRENGKYNAIPVELPDSWRFRSLRRDYSQQLYAVFQITDAQQNVYCSLPAALPNQNIQILRPLGDSSVGTEDFHADFFCRINLSPDCPSLQMEWELQGPGDEKTSVCLIDPIVNGSRITEAVLYEVLSPGETATVTADIDADQLRGIDRLESIEGTLFFTRENEQTEELPFLFRFPSSDLSALQPAETPVLAETESEEVKLQLLQVKEYGNTGWELQIYAENNGSEDAYPGNVLLNGIRLYAAMDTLPPHKSRIYTVHEFNFLSAPLCLNGKEDNQDFVIAEANIFQTLGNENLKDVRIVMDNTDGVMQQFICLAREMQEEEAEVAEQIIRTVTSIDHELKTIKRTLRCSFAALRGDSVHEAYTHQMLNELAGSFGYTFESHPEIALLTLKEPVMLGEARKFQKTVTFTSDVIIEPEDLPPVREEALPALTEDDSVCVRLRRAVTGQGVILLSMEWTNKTDHGIRVEQAVGSVNGTSAAGSKSVDLPSHSTLIDGFKLSGEFQQEVREIELSLTVYDENDESETVRSVTLVPSAPFVPGEKGSLWLNGEDFQIR